MTAELSTPAVRSPRPMRFLFAGQGYPGVAGTGGGSGIGTYVRELALGLTARGHRCHVLVWSEDGRIGEAVADGVTIHFVRRGRWPVLEQWWPDGRNAWNRGRAAARLDRRHRFDWVEIQSDEGIDHRVQRRFRGRAVLRVHTTLLQMCLFKEVTPNRLTDTWLAREKRSLLVADKIVTHSPLHASELTSLFPGIAVPRVVLHGYGSPGSEPSGGEVGHDRPRFLVVGTFDRRKGTDRLREVVAAYAARHGPCELRLVSPSPESVLAGEFGLGPPYPAGVTVRYLTRLPPEELAREYRTATAYLHPARYESFGYPLIEAASYATPVVATRTGIAEELLTGPAGRLLVDGDDPADCARALDLAVRSRGELGRQLHAVYADRFTRDHMTDRYLEVLGEWQSAAAAPQPAAVGP